MTTLTNPFSRLAPRTSRLKCVTSFHNRLRSLFHAIPKPILWKRLMLMPNLYHPYRRKHPTPIALGQTMNTFQSP